MYIYMCIYTHIFKDIHMHRHIYIYVYTYIYTHAHKHTFIYVYICTNLCMYMHVCMIICTDPSCLCTYAHICTHMNKYIFYTKTHTILCSPSLSLVLSFSVSHAHTYVTGTVEETGGSKADVEEEGRPHH